MKDIESLVRVKPPLIVMSDLGIIYVKKFRNQELNSVNSTKYLFEKHIYPFF